MTTLPQQQQLSLSPKILGLGMDQIGLITWILFLHSILSEVMLSVTSLIDMFFYIIFLLLRLMFVLALAVVKISLWLLRKDLIGMVDY